MAAPTIQLPIGSKGLNRDVPSFSLGPENYNMSLNMRYLNGSIQTVPQPELYMDSGVIFQPLTAINPVDFTQYTKLGATLLQTFVIGDNNGAGKVGLSAASNPPSWTTYPNPANYTFTIDPNYYPSVFVFNSVAVVNVGTNMPMYLNINDSPAQTDMKRIPNWFYSAPKQVRYANNSIVTVVSYTATTGGANITLSAGGVAAGPYTVGTYINWYYTSAVTQTILSTGSYEITAISGDTISIINVIPSTTPPAILGNGVGIAYPYFPKGMTVYNGRLIAYNLFLDRPGSGPINDVSEPITLLWSQPITILNSLSGIEWTPASTNSAGDDFITDTPGEILQALQMGQYLIAYKSDSVISYNDLGAPLFLTPSVLFTDDGILSARCAVQVDNTKHFVVGNYGIYTHQGSVDRQNISFNRIQDAFYNSPVDGIDLAYKGSTFVYHDVLNKEVWVCYRSVAAPAPSAGGFAGCDRAYIYNYFFDTWDQITLNNVTGITDVEVGGYTYTLLAQPSLNSTYPSGLYYLPRGAETEGRYASGGFVQFDRRVFGPTNDVNSINGVWPQSEDSFIMKLRFNNSIGDPISFSNLVSRLYNPSTDYRLDYRETGRYAHYRMEATTKDGTAVTNINPIVNPKITSMNLALGKKGRR